MDRVDRFGPVQQTGLGGTGFRPTRIPVVFLVIIMRLYKLPLILGYKIIKFYNQISNFICTLSPPRLMASFYPHHPLLI